MAKETKQKKETKSKKVNKPKTGKLQRAKSGHVLTPFEEMDRRFHNFFHRGGMRPFHSEWPKWGELSAPFEGGMPKVDVIDRDDEIVVRAEVPGVDKDDLDVSVTDNSVTIKGESRHEEKEEKGDFYRSEISRGAFARTMSLPNDVDSAKIKTKFKDGVLELKMPKIQKAKRRKIKIS